MHSQQLAMLVPCCALSPQKFWRTTRVTILWTQAFAILQLPVSLVSLYWVLLGTPFNQLRPVPPLKSLKVGRIWDRTTRVAIGLACQSTKARSVDISQQNTAPGLIRAMSGRLIHPVSGLVPMGFEQPTTKLRISLACWSKLYMVQELSYSAGLRLMSCAVTCNAA